MARHLQRLAGLQPNELQPVAAHPAQLQAVDVVAELIEQLRGLSGWRDYYEFQRRLFGGLKEAEERFRYASRNAKRVQRGKAPLSPPLTGDWDLDRLVYRRIGLQLRSLGDALAWGLFDYDRQVILALSRNELPGPMFGKEGLDSEVNEVYQTWHNEGVFALLHDMTNCLRIADVTKFRPGRAELVEIKKDRRRLRREQTERMERVVATFNDNTPLMVDGAPVDLLRTSQQHRTHLPRIRDGLEQAQRAGGQTVRLGTGWVATIRSVNPEGVVTAEDALAFIQEQDRLRDVAFDKAQMSDSQHHLQARSIDRAGLDPAAAPYAIYPFDPMTCALLTCDFLSFETTMSWERFSGAFEQHGLTTQSLLPAEAGPLDPGIPIIIVSRGDWNVGLGASSLGQVLLEFLDPRVFAAGIRDVVDLRRDIPAGILTFANERATWR